MNSSIYGKVALVTGGSSGIGRAAAVALANEGATVVIASRQQAVAEDALQVIRQAGGGALWIEADVSRAAHAKAMVEDQCAVQPPRSRCSTSRPLTGA
jgi:NAD(P)-dependent dehydrogenase (short-subunit alcohol dehydrogenase family)